MNCYLKVQLIRRNQLTPRFISAPVYNVDLPEIQYNSGRLRQRLFQIIALLDHNVYDRKLEVRYRIVDSSQHFIINRYTGYIAAKQPLNPLTIYEFQVREHLSLDLYENEIYVVHLRHIYQKYNTYS